MKYKRVLLKISGEMLGGDKGKNLDFVRIKKCAQEIVDIQKHGIEIAVVVGGGNIFRGRSIPKDSINRATADYMGMVGTIINAVALQAEIEQLGADCRVLSAISIKEVAEDYVRRQAMNHLAQGRIVLFAAGTGNPFFTTDTTAALRAVEIEADIFLKATTNVDGVYTSDPRDKKKKAKKLTRVSFHGALTKRLAVMDSTAFSLCRDNNMPIVVFKYRSGAILRILKGEQEGTMIS